MCGAIPIVRSRRGVPAYGAIYGGVVPMIDADDPDWLSQVSHVLSNDTFYLELIDRWREAGRARVLPPRSMPTTERAKARRVESFKAGRVQSPVKHPWHCQWFGQAVLRQRARRVAWEPCSGIVGAASMEWPWSHAQQRRGSLALGRLRIEQLREP